MDHQGPGKAANSSFSIRYNANNEALEEVFPSCDDDPPTPQNDASPSVQSENASPKKLDKSASIIDKYFKSIRTEKAQQEESKSQSEPPKPKEDEKSTPQKDVNSSPMKDYLNRLGKRAKDSDLNLSRDGDGKEGPNETWKIFHDFKFKIAQAVEEMKSSRADDKEKSVPRENSVSDSEENSAIPDSDQHSVGDTDNQVSSLESSIQNLSELTQPITAKVYVTEVCLSDKMRTKSESSDDTQKNVEADNVTDKDSLEEDSLLDVESGVEALEEANMDGSALPEEDVSEESSQSRPSAASSHRSSDLLDSTRLSSIPTDLDNGKRYFFTFSMTLLTVVLFLSYTLLPAKEKWNGFLLGMWVLRFTIATKNWLADWLCNDSDEDGYNFFKRKRTKIPIQMSYTIPSVKEHRPMKKYEGWINHYRYQDYDPYSYHINRTATAFMKMEGCNLRISYTKTKIPKKAFWDEHIGKVTFYQHRFYNLAGARVILLPKGLVHKRLWSKKYPICIILSEKEKVQVLEREPLDKKEANAEKSKPEPETSEATPNSDGVKHKRKFVWRRRVRDPTDSSKGLRQRISRKVHKDKKMEDASTSTEPETRVADKTTLYEDDYIESVLESTTKSKVDQGSVEELDSEQYREYMKIKEFLDEAEELEAGAGAEAAAAREGAEAVAEWSLHVKDSKDLPTNLYIFSRTSRDKHEWYRRINAAIAEANGTTDDNVEDSRSDPATHNEMGVFKIADKEAIAYAKQTTSSYDVAPEPVAVSWADETLKTMDMRAHERDFWPYMYRIIQQSNPSGSGTGVSEFGSLPIDMAWLNVMMGRVVYDAMRNPAVVARAQRRIQRKLNTLKLPSFMGGLVATELSLGSSTPLVEAVGAPTCDERGVWVDADVRYEGGAYISLNTQINLIKLKERKITLEEEMESMGGTAVDKDVNLLQAPTVLVPPPAAPRVRIRRLAMYDSEVDDSAESSTDEDSGAAAAAPDLLDEKMTADIGTTESGSSTKKFLKMVDKFTTSKYFQQISDYKYVKRAMEGLSNTDIRLHLELKGLEGRLAINLPPPPHDRVWVGFRSNPRLWLKARPALGARAVRFTHITNWIEQKLCKEFEKVLVLPNMEDLIVELMTPTPVQFE